jgi:hypothetical protein
MNVHYLNKEAREDILGDAVEDVRKLFARECTTIWEVCDCIDDPVARDAVEDMVGLIDHLDPAPETIVVILSTMVSCMMSVPFAFVDLLDEEKRLNGAMSNGLKFYGLRLTDMSARIIRALDQVHAVAARSDRMDQRPD